MNKLQNTVTAQLLPYTDRVRQLVEASVAPETRRAYSKGCEK